MSSGTINDAYTMTEAFTADLRAGDELVFRAGTYSPPAQQPTKSGSNYAPITLKPYKDPITGIYERVIFDGNFVHAKDWLCFERIEFMYSGWTSRESAEAGSAPSDIPAKDASLRGNYNKYIGCIFHDLRSAVLWYGNGGEMHDCLSYFHGWQGTDRKHGHAYYVHNSNIPKRMVNCLGFDSFGYGVAEYSASTFYWLANLEYKQCAFFGSGRLPAGGDNYNFHVGGESGIICYNTIMDAVTTFDGKQVRLGYNSGGNVEIKNCFIPDGLGDVTATITDGGGNVYELDDRVLVWPSEVIPNRGNVIVYNTIALSESVQVDVSSILSIGDSYKLHNARDYWVDVQTGIVAGDGTISIDMQVANRSIAQPVALAPIANGFPGFGAFVLERA